MHDENELLKQAMPYITTIVLSCWGGCVQHIQKLRTGRKFRLRELFFDLITSSFAGLLTHFFCVSAGIDGAQAAILVAVSGHMGTRAIASFQVLHERIFSNGGDK